MVSFLRYIIPAFYLFGVIDLSAQDVPWLTPSASLNAVPLTINCIPRADGQSLREGDYIGIFNEQNK